MDRSTEPCVPISGQVAYTLQALWTLYFMVEKQIQRIDTTDASSVNNNEK